MPKSNFISMLTKDNATSPFAASTGKKKDAINYNLQKPMMVDSISAGPTAAKPSPSPAKTQYMNSIAPAAQSGLDVSGVQSPVASTNSTIGGMKPPTANPMSRYQSAMDEYIKSLSGTAAEDDLYSKRSKLLSDTAKGQKDYADRIAEIGRIGAGAVAGDMTTGTNAVGKGNAAISSMSASSRMGALADAQGAALQGAEFESGILGDELNRRATDRTQKSTGLKARADYEQSLLGSQEIGGKLVRMNPETGAYEEVYAPEAENPEGFELGEGQKRYEWNPETKSYQEIAFNPKTYKAEGGGGGIMPLGGDSPFVAQDNYRKLTANQKKQADSLNNLVRTLTEYEAEMNGNTGGSGVNLFGADSGLLQTKLNSIIFAAAQAEGTGALQQADREVIEQIVPNPTNLKGAFNTLTKGGKSGNIAKIKDQINKYTQNLAGYGLVPVGAPQKSSGPNIITAPDGRQIEIIDD